MNNIAFSRVLKMNGRLWEFNFRKLPGESTAYHTDFTDAKDNRVQFTLYKNPSGSWQVKGAFVPTWIGEEIKLLVNVIEENTVMVS